MGSITCEVICPNVKHSDCASSALHDGVHVYCCTYGIPGPINSTLAPALASQPLAVDPVAEQVRCPGRLGVRHLRTAR